MRRVKRLQQGDARVLCERRRATRRLRLPHEHGGVARRRHDELVAADGEVLVAAQVTVMTQRHDDGVPAEAAVAQGAERRMTAASLSRMGI